MKKRLLIAAILICTVFGRAFSQRKIEYGFRLGGGLAIQHIEYSNILSNQSVRTFNANVVVSFPVLQTYYLRTGLGISTKGTEYTEDGLTTTNKIRYVELPLNLVRKYTIHTLGKLVAGVGGYLARANGGSLTYVTPNSTTENKAEFGKDNDFNPLDAGINLITGLELDNRLTFNLGYDFGLYNVASQNLRDNGYKAIYNREFTITLGLMF